MDPRSLSERDAGAVLATVVDLSASQLPLAEGLRAAAAESRGRVGAGLRRLASAIEQGRSLAEACGDQQIALPPHLRGLVAAAARTGQLGSALEELLQHQFRVRRTFWRVWGSLAYPAIVLFLNVAVIGFLMWWVVPIFARMFEDFDLQLPMPTVAVIAISDLTIWIVEGDGRWGALAAAAILGLLAYLTISGRGGVFAQQYIVEPLPIFGALWQWTGAAGFFYLLGVLLDKDVPLDEALRLAAAGSKAHLRHAGVRMGDRIAAGEKLGDVVEATAFLPASSVPLLRWGERNDSLAEAAHTLSDMFRERVDLRADWLRSVSPPFVYVAIGLTAGTVIVALFMPLISLIQGLS